MSFSFLLLDEFRLKTSAYDHFTLQTAASLTNIVQHNTTMKYTLLSFSENRFFYTTRRYNLVCYNAKKGMCLVKRNGW